MRLRLRTKARLRLRLRARVRARRRVRARVRTGASPARFLARGVGVVLLLDALAPAVLLAQHGVPAVLDRVVRPA